MSESNIVIVHYNEPDKINEVEDGKIIAFLPEQSTYDESYTKEIEEILDDPRIKIVFSDVYIYEDKEQNIEYVRYLEQVSYMESDIPIFFKKQQGMVAGEGMRPKHVINEVINKGFFISHIASPVVRLSNERKIY